MILYKAYKVELKPNNRQKTLLDKALGIARFTYNWGLARRIELYEKEKKSTTAINQHKELCAIKKEQFPWMYEVTKCAPQEALINLATAYEKFFQRIKKGKKPGFPKFKSKHKNKDSFRVSSCYFRIYNDSIQISHCKKIRIKEKNYIPTDIKHLSVTIKKEINRYFAAVECEIEQADKIIPKNSPVIGIDFGIKTLLTCSNGSIFENPKNTQIFEKRLTHAHKNLSRSKKGSKNREKTRTKIQKVYKRIKNRRTDNLHKITCPLVKTKPRYIILEDLNLNGLMKNHTLSSALQDSSFGELKRQFEYKALWYGSEVISANRFFPSSKICRKCGKIKKELTLEDRVYICECGHVEDRDLNASINLERYGINTLSSRGIQACGESVRLLDAGGPEAISTKQEENKRLKFVESL